MNNITQSLKVILLAVIISFGISYAFAWVAPSVAPTDGNTAAPLNTSVSEQTKNGNLFLNALGITNSSLGALSVSGGAVFGNNVGIGTLDPSNKLTINLGNANNNQGILAISSGTESALQLKNTATGGKEWQILSTGGTAGAGQGKLQFYNKTNSVTGMIMTSAGNVGMGTTNPVNKLEVAGNIKASGTVCDGTGACIGGGIIPGTVIYKCPNFKSACAAGGIGGLPVSTTPCDGQLTDSPTCKYIEANNVSDCFTGFPTVTKSCVSLGNLTQ